MTLSLSPSVIYDTIRAHAAMRALDSVDSDAAFSLLLSPDHAGLVGLLIKNSFARLVTRLPAAAVKSVGLDSETAVTDPGEISVDEPLADTLLQIEVTASTLTAPAAMRRSLEQAVAMDVLATQAALEGLHSLSNSFRLLADADLAALTADLSPRRPFIRPRF